MDRILKTLDDVLLKSTLNDFKKYVEHNQPGRKFMIYSDYCIGDRHKVNDVVSFTIMPYDNFPDVEKRIIKSLAPKDLKKTNQIAPDFIEYLKDARLFHISFLLKSRKGITHSDELDQHQVVSARLDGTIEMLQAWCINTPTNAQYFESIIKKLERVKREMSKRSANFRLFRDITLIPLLAGYLAYLLTKEAKAEIVGWFSDRDCIVEALDGVAECFFHLSHHSLCERNNLPSSSTKIVYGIQRDETGGVWYDEQNRLPDYIAGTLADWNIEKNLSTMPKFIQMLENVFADNDFCVIVRLDFKPEMFIGERVRVSRTPFQDIPQSEA